MPVIPVPVRPFSPVSSFPGDVFIFVLDQSKPLPSAPSLIVPSFITTPFKLMQGMRTWQTVKPRTLQNKMNVELKFRKPSVWSMWATQPITGEQPLTACHNKPLRSQINWRQKGHSISPYVWRASPRPRKHRLFNCTVDREFKKKSREWGLCVLRNIRICATAMDKVLSSSTDTLFSNTLAKLFQINVVRERLFHSTLGSSALVKDYVGVPYKPWTLYMNHSR